MGISSSGLVSGLNVDEIVTQLMAFEQRPISVLQGRQQTIQTKMAAYLDLNGRIASFQSAVSDLNSSSVFNTRSIALTKTSSGVDLATAIASSEAAPGSYSLQVLQLAQAHRIASQGKADQDTTPISASSGSFSFKVGSSGAVTTLSVSTTTTLSQLRDAINAANAGVTASIFSDGSATNPYRLILASNSSGASNTVQVTSNPTTLDFSTKKIEEAYAYTSNASTYTGAVTSNTADAHTASTSKTYLVKIITAGTVDGTARYKYSTDGGINWTDNGGAGYTPSATSSLIGGNTENVKIAFTNSGTLSVDDRFSVDVFAPTLQSAQDAVVKVDNLTLTRSSNSVTDAIQGVTLDLLKADSSATVTLTVSSDASGVTSKVQDFIDAYNEVNTFLNEQLAYDAAIGSAKPLMGDATVLTLRHKLRSIISGDIPGLSTAGYQNLSQIGITSDKNTGALSLDSSKFSTALSDDPTGVSKVFLGIGAPSISAVTYVGKSTKTQAGTYGISVTTAPEQATVTGANVISSGISVTESLLFKFSKDYGNAAPTYTTFSVSLTAGSSINTVINTLNSSFATNGAGLSASNDGTGKIRIRSTDYGKDIYLKVTDKSATNQLGFSSGGTIDQGVDIAGSINSHMAVGKGNILTAASGFNETGLQIKTTSSQTGSMGTIRVSLGVADQLDGSLGIYTDETNGTFKVKTDSLQESVDDIGKRIDRINERLQEKEKLIRAQFARLESIVSKYQAQGQYLTNQLANLPKIGSK